MGGARQRTDPPVRFRPLSAAASATLGLALLASCSTRVVPEPRSATPAPTPAPAPPPPAPQAADWQDWPLTAGTWVYRQGAADLSALYGPPASEALLTLSCDHSTRRIRLSVAGVASGSQTLTIRTSYGVLQWPAESVAGAMPQLVATRAASDQGLDWIVFSRGRFTVEAPGRAPLVLPTWAEPARVVEDCRG